MLVGKVRKLSLCLFLSIDWDRTGTSVCSAGLHVATLVQQERVQHVGA